jgi:hypothetical protein
MRVKRLRRRRRGNFPVNLSGMKDHAVGHSEGAFPTEGEHRPDGCQGPVDARYPCLFRSSS